MSIPTQRDRDMAALGDIATNVLQQLQTMERASPNDLTRMRAQLRMTLQEFADEVMATARRE
jgi:DNA-binding transcriptional regulator YiaG